MNVSPAARDASAYAVALYTLLLLINIFRESTAFGTINGTSHYTCSFYSVKQVGYGTVRLLLRNRSTYGIGLSLQKKW
jgi:hypothetical protein